MNDTRLWAVVATILMVAVGVFGFFVGIQPQLAAAATARQSQLTVAAQNALNEVALAGLKADAENMSELQETLAEARLSIPARANLSSFLQQLSDLGARAGVTVVSLATQDAFGFVPAPEYADVVPAGISAERFVVIPIQIEVVGPRESVLAFIELVQTGDRLVLVTELSLDRDGDDASVARSTMSGQVYVLLDEPGDAVDVEEISEEANG